jgi:hypothetical protein
LFLFQSQAAPGLVPLQGAPRQPRQAGFVEKFVCRHTLHVQSFGYTLSVFLPLGSMKVLKNGLSF